MLPSVRLLRLARGLTQTDLASLCDMSASFLSNIENGRRALTDDVAEKLADELGCWPEALLGGHAFRAALQLFEDESPEERPGFVERQAVRGRRAKE